MYFATIGPQLYSFLTIRALLIAVSLILTAKLTIYLPKVLCLSVCDSVCVSQFVAERSAILLVLAIKLTKATRRKVWRGRD
jgi:hypothetical protein